MSGRYMIAFSLYWVPMRGNAGYSKINMFLCIGLQRTHIEMRIVKPTKNSDTALSWCVGHWKPRDGTVMVCWPLKTPRRHCHGVLASENPDRALLWCFGHWKLPHDIVIFIYLQCYIFINRKLNIRNLKLNRVHPFFALHLSVALFGLKNK